MKQLLFVIFMLIPMIARAQEPIHKEADVVFFCKGDNILDDEGLDIVVERVAIYKDNKMAFVKLKDKSEELIRKIDTSFDSENMQMHILNGGGCVAISYETSALSYSPLDGSKYVAFELDMSEINRWIRETGKSK